MSPPGGPVLNRMLFVSFTNRQSESTCVIGVMKPSISWGGVQKWLSKAPPGCSRWQGRCWLDCRGGRVCGGCGFPCASSRFQRSTTSAGRFFACVAGLKIWSGDWAADEFSRSARETRMKRLGRNREPWHPPVPLLQVAVFQCGRCHAALTPSLLLLVDASALG